MGRSLPSQSSSLTRKRLPQSPLHTWSTSHAHHSEGVACHPPQVEQVGLVFALALGNMYLLRPRWLSGKESACSAGDAGDWGSIPGSGRSPGGGNGNPLQCSCLENSTDRGPWWATVHGVSNSRTQLSDLAHIYSVALCRLLLLKFY